MRGPVTAARICAQNICDSLQMHGHAGSAGPNLSLLQPDWIPQSRAEEIMCRVCPERPADQAEIRLCRLHWHRWQKQRKTLGEDADFAVWLAGQDPLPGYGRCVVAVCVNLAESPLGMCQWHRRRYTREGRAGGATLPSLWDRYERRGEPVPIEYVDEQAFRGWCAAAPAPWWPGQANLKGLRPLVRTEFKWGLFIQSQRARPRRWDLVWLRSLIDSCRAQDLESLIAYQFVGGQHAYFTDAIVKEILHELRLVYFTPAETKVAGFIETDHYGVRFPNRGSHINLTSIAQQWLRDLVWDYLTALLQSPRCPRTRGVIDGIRRAAIELSAFLAINAPDGGHNPTVLDGEHMSRFVADQRRREREGEPSLAVKKPSGEPSIVTNVTRMTVFNTLRQMLRDAMDTGVAEQIGLAREFIVTVPTGGETRQRNARRPYSDGVARALADEDNLRQFAQVYDPHDLGLRDMWEIVVTTGRRVREVVQARWDCLGRYNGLPMFWHDQTKVGNYDVAIRIPERLYDVIAERQTKTLDRFTAHHGRRPAGAERAGLALFPTTHRNHDGTQALSYNWFHTRFQAWITALDLGHCVPHQARHTLATNLLRAGASLTHIRRYLGQVSDRMAEHYVHLSNSDLEDVLQQVWVAGPGTANPGELLTSDASPMTRAQAQALAIDLSRRSTPAEGGFCTFQPVVDGGACPWNLDCHNCDKFVLSGADLMYWRRKREQWRQLAEGAPDDATAEYLHRHFEPTARAIDGLERALAGLGLLDQALALDLRKPQDYFRRVWSTAFRASDLATTVSTADDDNDHTDDEREACA